MTDVKASVPAGQTLKRINNKQMSSSDSGSSVNNSSCSSRNPTETDDEYVETIEDARRLLESLTHMERMMSSSFLTTPPRRSLNSRELASTQSSTSGNNNNDNDGTSERKTPTSREIQIELERINRLCDSVDHNLQPPPRRRRRVLDNSSISSANATTSPAPTLVIDLSDAQYNAYDNYTSTNDDVTHVSTHQLDVVDLCTPERQSPVRRVHHPISQPNNTSRRALMQRRTQLVQPEPQSQLHTQNRNRLRRHTQSRDNARITSQQPIVPFAAAPSDTAYNLHESGSSSTFIVHASSGGDFVANFGPDSSPRDSIGLKCPVCMEPVHNREPTTTRCGHVFCGSCIRHALSLQRKCPMCKTNLNPKTLLRLYL